MKDVVTITATPNATTPSEHVLRDPASTERLQKESEQPATGTREWR